MLTSCYIKLNYSTGASFVESMLDKHTVTGVWPCVDPFSGSECVDPEDPTVIAETELLGAAASIEAAAKKLEQLKPRAKPKV